MSRKLRTAATAVAIIGAGIFAVTFVCGLLYEQAGRARDREMFPPVGRAVDIGGRTLQLSCSGTGQPAVIFESGAEWATFGTPKAMFERGGPRPGYAWVAVQREVAKSTTACWYDRAGSGWSDLGPYPRDSEAQARDLHALLSAAGVQPPYVLVAESSAVLDARVFTGLYAAEVAGLVFVDGFDPSLVLRTHGFAGRFAGRGQDFMAQASQMLGFFRLGAGNPSAPSPAPKGMTDLEWNTVWHLARSGKARSALLQDIAVWQQSSAEARAAGRVGSRPLLVLSPADHTDPDQQTQLASLSDRAQQITIQDSTGEPIYEAPNAVAQAVIGLVTALRAHP